MRSAKLKSTVIVVGCALALTAAAAAVHAIRRLGPQNSGTPFSGNDTTAVIRFVKDPEPAPALQSVDLTGRPIALNQWKGKVVIVDFWATWCGPCRYEIPILIALQKEYKDRLQIIGVSVDEDPPSKILAFTKVMGMNYPVIMDTPGLDDAWGGGIVLPTAFVVDTQGRVVQKHAGVYSQQVYDREIRSLLGMPVDARIETFTDTGQVMLKNTDRATSLPGVELAGLTDEQRKAVLHRLNAEKCTCGCDLTLAQCRLNDDTCPISLKRAAEVVQAVKEGKPIPPAPAKAVSANP